MMINNNLMAIYSGFTHEKWYIIWLVVDLALWKMMEWKSVGIMNFPIFLEK